MTARNLRLMLMTIMLLMSAMTSADDPLVFADSEQEARYLRLTTELRCLVCQNQNLADSDAPLAQDLRKQIYEMMQTGRDDDQIKTYLVDRYGDFVLYRPPMQGNTLILWLMPACLLLIGGTMIIIIVRKRARMLAEPNRESQ